MRPTFFEAVILHERLFSKSPENDNNAAHNCTAENKSGNMAAMREALGFIRAELHNNTIIARNLKHRLFDIADSALAKPPRNCDRFGGDIDKLREACARERGLNPEEDFLDVFPDWLLAPATEKKGGAE